MASQNIAGGLLIPSRQDEAITAINASNFALDATGEIVALVLRVPETGNLSRFEAYIGAMSNTLDNGLRFSFQDVDLSTGLPDGVVDQFATIASGSLAVGWANPGDFDSPRAVTRGDIVALVCDNPSFTASDNLVIGGLTISTSMGIPYAVRATNTKDPTNLPIFALRYDDGHYAYVHPEFWGVQQISSVSMQTDTTPDEFGLAFQVPWPCNLSAVSFAGRPNSANNTYDVVVYDSDGTSVLSTLSCDGDVSSLVTGVRQQFHWFTADIPLVANTTYRVVMKAGSSTLNSEMYYGAFNSLALMDTVEGGQAFYATARTDAGAWTDYNTGGNGFRKPRMSLLLNGFDDGTGGGGSAGGAHIFGGTVIR